MKKDYFPYLVLAFMAFDLGKEKSFFFLSLNKFRLPQGPQEYLKKSEVIQLAS